MKNFLIFLCSYISVISSHGHPGHPQEDNVLPDSSSNPIIAIVYSDFNCEPCAKVDDVLKAIDQAVDRPLYSLFKHVPIHPDHMLKHEASLAAAEQGVFKEFHKYFFENQDCKYSDILEKADKLSLDLGVFQSALENRKFRSRVNSDINEAKGLGIKSVPTIFINGIKIEGIDQLQAFADSLSSPSREALDTEKVYDFDLKGSPSHGTADAPIEIVEFSDYRCGYCGRNSRTIDQLVALYPGKIRRVFKHFPIQVNDFGTLAHRGAMAASNQISYWTMHKALMNSPLQGEEDLISRAIALGLNIEKFRDDLKKQFGVSLIQRDIAEGDLNGIRSTPTTFINGRYFSGERTLENYRAEVESVLSPDKQSGYSVTDPKSSRLSLDEMSGFYNFGPKDAFTVIEFYGQLGDNYSKLIFSHITKLYHERKDINITFRNFLDIDNKSSLLMHQVAGAAAMQSKFWSMKTLIDDSGQEPDMTQLINMASNLELDTLKLKADISSETIINHIRSDISKSEKMGVPRAGTVFVNGELYKPLNSTYEELRAFIDENLCCGKF